MADAWFEKDQYSTLRKEVENCMSELATLEKACIGGVAAIFAWVAKDSGSYVGFEKFAWLVPSIIPMYGALKAQAIAAHLDVLGKFLGKIEVAQLPQNPKVEGWQEYFERDSSYGVRTRVARSAWLAFTILTVIGSVVGFAKA